MAEQKSDNQIRADQLRVENELDPMIKELEGRTQTDAVKEQLEALRNKRSKLLSPEKDDK